MKNSRHAIHRLAGAAVILTLATSLSGQVAIISDFTAPDWSEIYTHDGMATYAANGQLTVTGNLPPITSGLLDNFTYVSWYQSLSLADSETIELKVDLVDADEEDVQTLIQFKNFSQGGYALAKDRDEIWLTKFQWVANGGNAPFFYEPISVKSTNVTLVLSVTRAGSSAIIRSAVLDKDNFNLVLFERTVVDTPGVDPTVASFRGQSFYPDPGAAYLYAEAADLAVMSFSSTNESNFQLVLDDFRYRRFIAPKLDIERIGAEVILSWPASAEFMELECAPQPSGPWTNATETVVLDGDRYKALVDQNRTTEFYRLRWNSLCAMCAEAQEACINGNQSACLWLGYNCVDTQSGESFCEGQP